MPVSVAAPSHQRITIARKPQDQTGLNVAVVRLLALALGISGGWSPAPPAAGLLVPFGYRDWPSVTSLVQARTGSITVLWYLFTDLLPESMQVDLKAAVTSLKESDSDAGSKKKGDKKKRR